MTLPYRSRGPFLAAGRCRIGVSHRLVFSMIVVSFLLCTPQAFGMAEDLRLEMDGMKKQLLALEEKVTEQMSFETKLNDLSRKVDRLHELSHKVEKMDWMIQQLKSECDSVLDATRSVKDVASMLETTRALKEAYQERNETEHEERRLLDEESASGRRLGAIYTGCYSVTAASADLDINVSSLTECAGSYCPDCFVTLPRESAGSTAADFTLKISACSNARIIKNEYTGVRVYTFVNMHDIYYFAVTDGTETVQVAPMTSIVAHCYSSGSDRLYFPNYRLPTLRVDRRSDFTGTTTHENALHVLGTSTLAQDLIIGDGGNGVGITLTNEGNVTLSDALLVLGQSTMAHDLTIGGGHVNGIGRGITLTNEGSIEMSDFLLVGGTSTFDQDMTVGLGHGGMGVTIRNEGTVTMSNALHVLGTSTLAQDLIIGDGGNGVGITLTNEGNVTMSDALLVLGQSTMAHDLTIGGGGYPGMGITLTNEGTISMSDDLTLGSGGGATGITLTNEGALTMSANLLVHGTSKVVGTSTFISLSTHSDGLYTGSGYLGTGATLSAAGELSIDSNLIVGGTAEVVSNSTFRGDVEIDGQSTLGNELGDTVVVKGRMFASSDTNPGIDFAASSLVRF